MCGGIAFAPVVRIDLGEYNSLRNGLKIDLKNTTTKHGTIIHPKYTPELLCRTRYSIFILILVAEDPATKITGFSTRTLSS